MHRTNHPHGGAGSRLPFGPRTAALVAAALLALALALALYASQAAKPAEAYSRVMCKVSKPVHHRGAEGRLHKETFVSSYGSGKHHHHVVRHWTRYSRNGASKWVPNWKRSFQCRHDVSAVVGSEGDTRTHEAVDGHGHGHGHGHDHAVPHPDSDVHGGHVGAHDHSDGAELRAP